jgi:hypothetical protein
MVAIARLTRRERRRGPPAAGLGVHVVRILTVSAGGGSVGAMLCLVGYIALLMVVLSWRFRSWKRIALYRTRTGCPRVSRGGPTAPRGDSWSEILPR